jgi:dihydroorotate dehydrogenase
MLHYLFSRIKPLLYKLDAEQAHDLTIMVLSKTDWLIPKRTYEKPFILSGLTLNNRLGLAAGFDKNALATQALLKLGFGFVEIGTVTPKPQIGNPKPRLFRLTADTAIINRMGFNNDGAEIISKRMQKIRDTGNTGIIGVNIGANKDSDNRIADYARCTTYFTDTASYFTVNVSSPNTAGLRDLQATDFLKRLLEDVLNVAHKDKTIPVLLKIAPDRADYDLSQIIHLINTLPITGIIASNTTISRPDSLTDSHKNETGGLSGKPLMDLSTQLLKDIKRELHHDKILIGAGGISNGDDAITKIHAGSDAVQIYSGLIYYGKQLIDDIIKEFKKRDL